ncbi:ATP F0F1 synthase synthase [Planococcus plakortidis]|uniref:ATP F0F1 synthase synthase n=1 Tax=Planococcus plakortidis TaxID=1038856 RepID=UPI00385D378E
MSDLMVKLKGDQDYKKVLNLDDDTALFPSYDITYTTEYDPKYILEEEEYFTLTHFSQKPYFIDILEREFSDVEYNTLNEIKESKIEYIFWIDELKYYFQRVTPSQIVERKIISLKKNKLIQDGPSLIVKDEADAFYNRESDTLYFRNLNAIKSIFPGIDFLFREATKEEVEEFLSQDFIKLDSDYGVDSVKTYNRKRIGLVSDLLNQMDKDQLDNTLDYVRKYCEDLKFDAKEQKFILESEGDLKSLVFGIDQRFYTTEVSGEKRLANSVTKIT